MDNMRIKAIEYFASKPHNDPKALKFFDSIYADIKEVLENSVSYDSIASSLENLEKFVSFVSQQAISDLVRCWKRIHLVEKLLSRDSFLEKFHTKDKLYLKIITLLSHLRYLEQDTVMPIMVEFWKEEQLVREEIEKSFKNLAEFNLHAFEKIGFTPQLILLEFLNSLSLEKKFEIYPITVAVMDKFLSTEIEGHSWNYRTVSIKSMAIPESEQIVQIRNTTLEILMDMFGITENVPEKKELLSLLNKACKVWTRFPLSEGAKSLVEDNTVDVLNFWLCAVDKESLEIIQLIEHDSYWTYYHSSSKKVKDTALKLEEFLAKNSEYQTYKDLVGFQGIFGSWQEEVNLRSNYEASNKIRQSRIAEHINNLSEENVDIWLDRIESYLMTDSTDLATFPELNKFVQELSMKFPNEVLTRLEKDNALSKSRIPIFMGIWNSSIHDEFKQRINKWLEDREYLWEITTAFTFLNNVESNQIDALLIASLSADDPATTGVILRIFEQDEEKYHADIVNAWVQSIFSYLNDKMFTDWINHVWFARKGQSFLEVLTERNLLLIIDNLVFVNNIDHRVEGIIEHIHRLHNDLIYEFFEKRIKFQKDRSRVNETRYEDIPFSLHSIKSSLSEKPEKLLSLIKRNYVYEYGVESYGVASLLHKCFSPFENSLTDVILENFNPQNEDELNVIVAMISGYEGHPSILPFVEKLLALIDYSEDNNQKFCHALFQTGVTTGDYGHVNAIKSKLEDMQPWLQSENANVIKFAYFYQDKLSSYIEHEMKRVDEQIIIEKHKYGVDTDLDSEE